MSLPTEELERLLDAHNNAQWECAEWDVDDSEERFEVVWLRAKEAENKLRAAIGLPPTQGTPDEVACI